MEILKKPAWLIALALVLLFILMALAYFKGTPFGYVKTDDGLKVGFLDQKPVRTVQFYGFFNDWDSNKNTVTNEEEINMEYYDDFRVSAVSTGYISIAKGKEQKSWNISGYDIGSRLILSYITKLDKPTGAGVYFLKEEKGSYVGSWQGVDCSNRAIIRCPYILTTQNMTIDQAKQKWPVVLGEQCRYVSEDAGELCQ